MVPRESAAWLLPSLRLSSGCLIDEPAALTERLDAGSRRLAGTRADRVEDRRLLLAGHQKCDLPAALNHRIGHGDADLRPPVGHSGDPALPLLQHRIVRQQRGSMAIGAKA